MRRLIPQEEYLRHALMLAVTEKELIKEFGIWLPEQVIDCHAHCNLPEHVESIGEKTFKHMLSTFTSFSLEQSAMLNNLFYGAINVRTLRFAKTFRGVNHREANRYLLENSPLNDRVALFGLADDLEYTIRMLSHPRVSALKMYHSYVEPSAKEIYEFFPKEVLEVAQSLDKPIILHPPVNITKCLGQIERLAKDFPRLRICIAHLGLVKSVVPGLKEAYEIIARLPLVHMDTALVPSAEVVAMALEKFGSDRIMFGSDAPLNMIRSMAYQHPVLGERIVTTYPYHWQDKREYDEYTHLSVGAVHAHWQSLSAIKTAIMNLPEVVRIETAGRVFYNNAFQFYGF